MRRAGLRAAVAFILALALAAMEAMPAVATAGHLDTSFGLHGNGKVTTHVVPGDNSGAQAMAIQPDGRIVAAGGTSKSDTGGRFAVVRYLTDGSLDSSFRGDGTVATAFGDLRCAGANAMALGLHEKIVLAGTAGCSPGRFALARYLSNGKLDTSFSGDGRVTTRFGSQYAEVFGVAVQPDGGIVAVGHDSRGRVHLVRYQPSGKLDPTFGGDGRVTTDFTSGYDEVFGVGIQADGHIVVVGAGNVQQNNTTLVLARYGPNGKLDPTFGGDGRVTTHFGDCPAEGHALAIQPDEMIVAAGWAGCTSRVALARYKPNGKLDAAFGDQGRVTTLIGKCGDEADAVAVGSDGKIVAAGWKGCLYQNFALARYNSDGSLDTSFGKGGTATTVFQDSESDEIAKGVAIQTDGNVVAAGGSFGSAGSYFCVARWLGA
jgi:uncharacterized delta-60 repeat protein